MTAHRHKTPFSIVVACALLQADFARGNTTAKPADVLPNKKHRARYGKRKARALKAARQQSRNRGDSDE